MDSLFVNATYNTAQFGRQCLLFVLALGNKRFTIAAMALLLNESKEELKWAFQQLRAHVGEAAWGGSKVVMTYGERSYPALLAEILPLAIHQLCQWHMQRSMKPTVRQLKHAAQVHVMMDKAMNSHNEIEAECAWQRIQDEHITKEEMIRSATEWKDKLGNRRSINDQEADVAFEGGHNQFAKWAVIKIL